MDNVRQWPYRGYDDWLCGLHPIDDVVKPRFVTHNSTGGLHLRICGGGGGCVFHRFATLLNGYVRLIFACA
ncbi:hypothetical protein PENSUB_4361 [Penicillium subrubescens]|uniref:Uncharacterized protein n=1 Tax=Penicillium subrubescens TaxID=1316194 RepID=A0A1Q5UCI3_9EURO|nr:hypothetical protein PENSUB_4361 [Penicillium subrubescens]